MPEPTATTARSYWHQRLDNHTLRFYSCGRNRSARGGMTMATLVRWDPFREVAAMQNELSRFMNGLTEGDNRQTQSWGPTLAVWETAAELVYAFDLPGIPQDKIAVEVENGTLTISAER